MKAKNLPEAHGLNVINKNRAGTNVCHYRCVVSTSRNNYCLRYNCMSSSADKPLLLCVTLIKTTLKHRIKPFEQNE